MPTITFEQLLLAASESNPQKFKSSYEKLINELLQAATLGNLSKVKEIVEIINRLKIARADLYGLGINSQNLNSETALLLSAKNGHAPIVEYLLSQSADPRIPDRLNNTPLCYAISRTDDEMSKRLLERSQYTSGILNQYNAGGFTVLYLAVKNDASKEVIEALLKQGADPLRPTSGFGVVLELAKNKGLTDVVKLLEKAIVERKARKEDAELANFSKKIRTVKEAGHILGLKESDIDDYAIPIQHPVLGKSIGIQGSGDYQVSSFSTLSRLLERYSVFAATNSSDTVIVHLEKIRNAYKVTERYLNFDGTVTEADLVKRSKEGELTVLPAGWGSTQTGESGHGFTLSLYRQTAILCNRGAGSERHQANATGTIVYDTADDKRAKEVSGLVNEVFIKDIRGRSKGKTQATVLGSVRAFLGNYNGRTVALESEAQKRWICV